MTRHEIAKLACKILALWFFCQVALTLYSTVMHFGFSFWAAVSNGHWEGVTRPLFLMVAGAGSLVLGLILWRCSDAIASRMAAADQMPVTSKSLDARTLLAVALSTVGVFFAMQSIGSFSKKLIALPTAKASLSETWKDTAWQTDFWAEAVTFAVALWLIFGSRGLANIIRRYRTYRVRPAEQPQQASVQQEKDSL